ncbi:MAG: amidohydrolase family protein [Chitinophagaceae bacterium]
MIKKKDFNRFTGLKIMALSFFLGCFICSLPKHARSQSLKPPNTVKVTVSEGTNMAIAVSPDGKTIAMDIQGTIHTIPIGGGRAKALTDGLGDERQPCWSPDGSKIAFQSYRDGTYHIWMIDKNGSGLKQVTFGNYDEREPQWSPDGKRILYSSDRAGNYDIWELSLADGAVKQFTTDVADDFNPAWSPDGNRIAFISTRKASGLYIRDASDKEQLIVPVKGTFAAPSWSPDGRYITYNGLAQGKSRLFIVSAADGKLDSLSGPNEDVFPFRTAWLSNNTFMYSSDGKIKKRILGDNTTSAIPFTVSFTLDRAPYKKKIRDFDSDAANRSMGIFGPVVSPDGNDIAFAAVGNLWLLKKGNEKPVHLTNDAAVDIDPAFSPDGKKLAFVSDREGKSMAIWVRDLQTGTDTCLTSLDKDVMYPTWSPDGTRIAFLLNDANSVWGNSALNVMEVATGSMKQVHALLFVPGKPSWSADGKFIALSALEHSSLRFREGISRMLLISLDSGTEKFISPTPQRTLATREKNGPVWSPDGTKMAYVEDGVLWVVAVSPSGEFTGSPKQITTELADVPTWTGDNKSIIYISVDKLKKVHLADGSIEDIPLELSWKSQKPSQDFVIHAGRLFNGRTANYQKDVDIVVKDNRIVKIEPHQPTRKSIDASDKAVIPGMFEMHTHQYAGAGEVQGRNWLSYGITSVRETGADPYDALERKEAWNSGARIGPREFYAGYLLDGKRVYYGLSNSISNETQLKMELERSTRLGYDFIKTYVRLSDSLQKKVTAYAHQHGIPVSSHEIYPSTAYGVDNVEHIKATSRRGYSPKQSSVNETYEDVIQLMAKSGMNMTPTIALFGGFYLKAESDPDVLQNKQLNALYSKRFVTAIADASKLRLASGSFAIRETYPSTYKSIQKLMKAGAHITPGTDSPFIPYGLSLHVELQCFVAAGLTPFEALRSATLWSAEAVGVEKDLGTVEAGKLADFVIVNGDPLKNIKDAWNVETVFKNGIRYDIEQLLRSRQSQDTRGVRK